VHTAATLHNLAVPGTKRRRSVRRVVGYIGAAKQDLEAAGKLLAAVMRLAADGHALRRPTSAPLRDGVHELRVKVHRVNYRALYFFAGSGTAVLVHGCTKEGDAADADLDRAVARRLAYISDLGAHTAKAS